MPKQAFKQVAGQIRDLVDASYRAGRRAGKNLLSGLSNGTYTIGEFADKHARHLEEESDGE
jgi:hypothetical protein